MRVLSLFSGIGGFDLGFQRAGMDVVGMCEIDRHAQTVLRRRFPEATLHTDVRKVSYGRGAVDLICGGFPCQDLSVAGKRRGLAGERSGLWHEFARIIDESEPAWVVIENVPGLFSSNAGRDFAVIVDWLAQRGYGVGWRVLDAQGFGLAQRRKRVFIVASFGSPRGCTTLLESASVRRDFAKSGQARQGDTRATQDGADGGVPRVANTVTANERNTQFFDYSTLLPVQDIAPTLRAEAKQSLMPSDGNINAGLAITYAIEGHLIDRESGQNGIGIAVNAPMYTLTSTDRHAVGFNGQHPKWSALHEQSHTLTTKRVEQVMDVLWEAKGFDSCRIASDQECAPKASARMGTGGNNTPLIGVRRLTPTECERLQGFPDGWTEGQSDAQRYKQLGNAVAVPVAEWIGRRILTAVLR